MTTPNADSVKTAVAEIRKWQRHWLLRQYDEQTGQVLPENLALSEHIDTLIRHAETKAQP